MKAKTALREWKKSYRLSWHCVRGRYYGWPGELLAMGAVTLLFPVLFLLTLLIAKEPEDVERRPS